MNKVIAMMMGASSFATGVLATPPYYYPGTTQKDVWNPSKERNKRE